jgi:hypothetical protein
MQPPTALILVPARQSTGLRRNQDERDPVDCLKPASGLPLERRSSRKSKTAPCAAVVGMNNMSPGDD